MTSYKLILKNVRKNIQDYLIYFLTLALSVSLFYSFNSISSQPAFLEMDATKTLLYKQLGILLSALSIIISVALAFLIIYANGFLLKRRKKELGIYILSGMRKGRISRIFAGETLCVGIMALIVGLLLGVALSQGLSLIALKLFAIELSKFTFVFSMQSFTNTLLCFTIIFIIVMMFNVWTVSNVKLIDLLNSGRKNEKAKNINKIFQIILLLVSLFLIALSCVMFSKNGILPSRENNSFTIALIAIFIGIILFFYSISTVIIQILQANKNIYLKGLNAFFIRQISSKINTNYFILAIICGLLTITISVVSIGFSTALSMNELSQAAAPYDLNVVSNVEIDGDGDISEYLKSKNLNISQYAQNKEQISIYEADITYADLFAGQDLNLWPIDSSIPGTFVSAISISDFNQSLVMQGKEEIHINENEFLVNCNYKGTLKYIESFIKNTKEINIAGNVLQSGKETVLSETYLMTSVGNNDRGTLVLPDAIIPNLKKDINVLLVQYLDGINKNDVLQKLIPIGLDDNQGYRYSEKDMMYGMFYGVNALISFICCYIGLIFLLISAALLALKQLTETTDSIFRYGLLKKIGASSNEINCTIFYQTAVFFMAPLALAIFLSIILMNQAMKIVEDFMNIHIATNVIFTIVLFLFVYGIYFITTYLSCKKMIWDNDTK